MVSKDGTISNDTVALMKIACRVVTCSIYDIYKWKCDHWNLVLILANVQKLGSDHLALVSEFTFTQGAKEGSTTNKATVSAADTSSSREDDKSKWWMHIGWHELPWLRLKFHISTHSFCVFVWIAFLMKQSADLFVEPKDKQM